VQLLGTFRENVIIIVILKEISTIHFTFYKNVGNDVSKILNLYRLQHRDRFCMEIVGTTLTYL